MRPDFPSTDVENGLTAAEVAQRVAEGRTNDVPLRASRSVGEIVRANVFTRINAIFGVLFMIIVSTGYLLDGMFGLLILANSLVGMVQELRAKKTLDELSIVGQARPRPTTAPVLHVGPGVCIRHLEVVQVLEAVVGDQAATAQRVETPDGLLARQGRRFESGARNDTLREVVEALEAPASGDCDQTSVVQVL